MKTVTSGTVPGSATPVPRGHHADALKDPVCGMSVEPATARHQAEHAGQTYYFCSAGCRTKFIAEPARYLDEPAATLASESHVHGEHHTDALKDPVCGMSVEPATAKHQAELAGQTYYFCSAGCRTKFIAEPARYLGERPAAPAASPGAIYTCPMHPEVQQVGPGACPKCGMALEPLLPSAVADDGGELTAMQRRWSLG